jgi:hypothetical protein
MGEIKSTLDLVMARTRHLTLSETEKDEQRRQEGQKRLLGLMQHYEDGALSADRLAKEVDELQDRFGIDGRRELVRAATLRIDPNRDNTRWLEAMRNLSGIDLAEVEKAVSEYRAAHEALDRENTEEALARLADAGIAGSAVAANLSARPAWREAVAGLRRDFQRRINALQTGPGHDFLQDRQI